MTDALPISTPTTTATAAGDSVFQSSQTVSAPSAPSIPSTPMGPQQFADSFTRGIDIGAPMSSGTEALTHNVMGTAFSPTNTAPTDFSSPSSNFAPSTVPSSSHIAFDAQPTFDAGHTPASDTTSTMYAAPVAPMAPIVPAGPIAPAGPVVPGGLLPAYGSDLRPTPVAPPAPSLPSSASPTSAPVNPAGGASALSQQVVRQQPIAATSTTVPSGLTENAIAATATGTLAGAIAAEAAKRTRLQRLVEAVARQEPQLRWAIGEREDGTTILVTDLARGWIPPHVEIPTGVNILAPAQRRPGLESLLCEAEVIESWSPGQYLPEAKDVDPVPMSIRARDLPKVDDLNWELTQAANWRDGLPRLAHTLAKAGVAGTGILDSEGELLHEHLHAKSIAVLNAYPDVDPDEVGSWQLLAAIDALIASRRTSLNYHFAWFQTLRMATRGGGR